VPHNPRLFETKSRFLGCVITKIRRLENPSFLQNVLSGGVPLLYLPDQVPISTPSPSTRFPHEAGPMAQGSPSAANPWLAHMAHHQAAAAAVQTAPRPTGMPPPALGSSLTKQRLSFFSGGGGGMCFCCSRRQQNGLPGKSRTVLGLPKYETRMAQISIHVIFVR